jgi:flagellar protein FlaG
MWKNETQVAMPTADTGSQEFSFNNCLFRMTRSIMTRIDALMATQVADTTRPAQSRQDLHLQVAAARQREVAGAEESLLVADDAPSANELQAAIAHIKQVIEVASGRQLDFSVDDSGKTLLVKIVGDQGQVIRQIPSQEVLDLRERIDALVGAFINQKA